MLKNKSTGTKKTLSMTSGSFDYVTEGFPVTIPTSETTKNGRTLAVDDFPTWSFTPESVTYIEHCGVHGYNNSGGDITVYWKMYKNSVEVTSGNGSISNLNYFTVQGCFLDVAAGDLLEVAVWASVDTNVTLNGYTGHIVPTRLLPTSKNVLDVTEIFSAETVPAGSQDLYNTRETMGTGEASIIGNLITPVTLTHPAKTFYSTNNYNMYRYGRGDYTLSNTGIINSTTTLASSPKITSSTIPMSISYREINEGKL